MSLRFHEIAEANLRIQNPLSEEKLLLLGQICQLQEGMRHLDLACGNGELLCQWAHHYGTIGIGVDLSERFIETARRRADELEVLGPVTFVVDDAATYPQEHHQFDIVSCIGATWIGGGLVGTLKLMQTGLKDRGGLLVVGEPYWIDLPPQEAYAVLNVDYDTFATLEGTLDRFEAAGTELVEMVLADLDSWDRYEARQWMAVNDWLVENPDDRQADELRAWMVHNRRGYLTYGRRYMGWGVFVLRMTDKKAARAARVERERRDLRPQPDQPVAVDIRDDLIWVKLQDGRIIANPLDWYSWLASAAPQQQTGFQIGRLCVEWPELNQRLDVREMLRPHL